MKKKAFTLAEILIVVSIITVLSAGVIVLTNPLAIINKGNDTARKKDLDDAKKMLEQYMNDTGCYPQPTQVCLEGTNVSPCHICTKQQTAQFNYFEKDICDPKNGSMQYLYQTETAFVYKVGYVVKSCPTWFKLFSILDSTYNASEDIWGCKAGGCGVAPSYGYSYLVTSPNAPTDQIASSNWYCYTNDCIQCSPYENCTLPSNDCYGRELYPSRTSCCTQHDPSSPYCL